MLNTFTVDGFCALPVFIRPATGIHKPTCNAALLRRDTFAALQSKFDLVAFVPGNHELWVSLTQWLWLLNCL
jgi:hypothetical protein